MPKPSRFFPFIIFFLFQALIFSLVQFIAWPEMLYEPYLMNNGFLIYKDITIAHSPLLLFILQLWFKFFSDYVLALRLFTFVLTYSTGAALYMISKEIFKQKNAGVSVWFLYIIFQAYFEGNGVWFDHLVALWSLLAFFFFYKFLWGKQKRSFLLLSGFFLGLAGISKQTAGWLVMPCLIGFLILYLQIKKLQIVVKNMVLFAIACVIPWALLGIWLWAKGALPDYYFWSLYYGITVLPRSQGQIEPPSLRQLVGTLTFFIPVVLYLVKNRKESQVWFITAWTVCAFMGIYPRFERFHFQPAIPLLALIWVFLVIKKETFKLALPVIIASGLLVARFFTQSAGREVRFYEPDVVHTSNWLKENTKSTQPLYVFNTWDHFYALADRKAAVRPVPPTLKWYLEVPGLEDKIIQTLDAQPNPIVVMENYKQSGLGSYIPQKLDSYLKTNFIEKTVVDKRFVILEKYDTE